MDANSLGLSSDGFGVDNLGLETDAAGLGVDTSEIGTDASVFIMHTLALPPATVKHIKPDLELAKHTYELNKHIN